LHIEESVGITLKVRNSFVYNTTWLELKTRSRKLGLSLKPDQNTLGSSSVICTDSLSVLIHLFVL